MRVLEQNTTGGEKAGSVKKKSKIAHDRVTKATVTDLNSIFLKNP